MIATQLTGGMEAMRESWTDDRLDDLAKRMDAGFERVDVDLRELRGEMKAGFERVDGEFRASRGEVRSEMGQLDARIGELNARFDACYRVLLKSSVSTVVALLGLIGTLTLTRV